MVTIKDIAARLNVAASTVGRALADDSRISASMKQRVQEVADEIGYVANRAARMMRGVSSNLVGLIVPDVRNNFYSTIAHALSKCLEQEGFQLTLSESDDDRTAELRHVRELVSANVAGMILVPCARPLPATAKLLQAMPHIQLLREHASLGRQCFGIDDARALGLAVEHLLQLGHRRIAYIGPPVDLPTGAARLKGYRESLALSASHDPTLELCGAPDAPFAGGAGLAGLLRLPHPPSAVVVAGVRHTHAVVDECIANGIRVPEDLSIVGFGDEPGFAWWGAGLTTISLPVSEMATSCGLWFLHQLRQRSTPLPPYRSISTPSLIVRGSTQAVADLDVAPAGRRSNSDTSAKPSSRKPRLGRSASRL